MSPGRTTDWPTVYPLQRPAGWADVTLKSKENLEVDVTAYFVGVYSDRQLAKINSNKERISSHTFVSHRVPPI